MVTKKVALIKEIQPRQASLLHETVALREASLGLLRREHTQTGEHAHSSSDEVQLCRSPVDSECSADSECANVDSERRIVEFGPTDHFHMLLSVSLFVFQLRDNQNGR